MQESVYKDIAIWLAIGTAAAPAWGAVLWVIWQGVARPHLIPHAEVKRLAVLLVEQHGERAADVALANEYGAWRDSDGFAQGKWRRVRKYLEREPLHANVLLTSSSRSA
jgi:hypothetical protein